MGYWEETVLHYQYKLIGPAMWGSFLFETFLFAIISLLFLYSPRRNSIASLVSPCSGMTSSSNILQEEGREVEDDGQQGLSKFILLLPSACSSWTTIKSVFSSQSVSTLSRSFSSYYAIFVFFLWQSPGLLTLGKSRSSVPRLDQIKTEGGRTWLATAYLWRP